MSGEAEFASARVEGGEQLVRHGVAVSLEEVGGVVSHLAAVVAHCEAPRVRYARVAQPRVAPATCDTEPLIIWVHIIAVSHEFPLKPFIFDMYMYSTCVQL